MSPVTYQLTAQLVPGCPYEKRMVQITTQQLEEDIKAILVQNDSVNSDKRDVSEIITDTKKLLDKSGSEQEIVNNLRVVNEHSQKLKHESILLRDNIASTKQNLSAPV